jgi:transporter family-2 protein
VIAGIVLALLGGVLIGVSRQINGRLSLASGAMGASFWNHWVGFAALTLCFGVLAMAGDDLLPAAERLTGAPWTVYLAGPLGVLFVALGSVALLRIGAMKTAMLMIAGQMTAGLAIDLLRGAGGAPAASLIGVALIATGVALAARR